MADYTTIELVGTILAALLTIMVLSYLIGDNPLFRFATHMFIGVAAGYAGTIAWHNVLKPVLVDPFLTAGLPGVLDGSVFSGEQGVLIIGAWILIGMLLFKLSPSTSRWGSLPIVILVGVSVGVIIGGAITGTLIPQSAAAVASFSPGSIPPSSAGSIFSRLLAWLEPVFEGLIILTGTICTLLYFHFTTRKSPTGIGDPPKAIAILAKVGKVFITITFATMYAGVLSMTLIVLAERMSFLMNIITDFVSTL